jgi:hypothetical protein
MKWLTVNCFYNHPGGLCRAGTPLCAPGHREVQLRDFADDTRPHDRRVAVVAIKPDRAIEGLPRAASRGDLWTAEWPANGSLALALASAPL